MEQAYQAYLKGRDLSRKQLKEALRDSVKQFSGPGVLEKTKGLLDDAVEEVQEMNNDQNEQF